MNIIKYLAPNGFKEIKTRTGHKLTVLVSNIPESRVSAVQKFVDDVKSENAELKKQLRKYELITKDIERMTGSYSQPPKEVIKQVYINTQKLIT